MRFQGINKTVKNNYEFQAWLLGHDFMLEIHGRVWTLAWI